VIEGGRLRYADGRIAVPTGPGLGVELDRDKLGLYAEAFQRLGGYPYDRDPSDPAGFPLLPKQRYPDPTVSAAPSLDTPAAADVTAGAERT
jgi:glucarate dehydratase